MVIVPFTISAWFLWCTDFSIPKVGGLSTDRQDLCKNQRMGFPASIQKTQVPAKKNKKKTNNKKQQQQ